MKINEIIQNFRVTAISHIDELAADLVQMEHEKSGARLVWLDRASDNKTFGIAFRTTPEDDTGVFHILEHSVLCGSEKYPVKDPFVELMKSSMQTFLNAITFPDKTVYPVSSRNDKDFTNLMRVYLDAVFFPAIYTKPEIFYQEGWHYELRDGEPLSYKGVVFNEMKGALASPDDRMQEELERLLFPDTCYRYNSGGDPVHIPELTYEKFVATHKRFYHPSNSYIFLDGSVDLPTCLGILDQEYLSRFTRQEMHTEVATQKPVTGHSTRYYAVAPSEPLEGKARVAWGYCLGDYTCRKERVAMQVLSELLCGSNQAPLKKQILTMAGDGSLRVISEMKQSYVILSAEHLDEKNVPALKASIDDTLRHLIETGLDHDHLRAALANLELQARERDYHWIPQGIGLGMDMLESWLYGGDPGANLPMAPLFAELNALVDTGWYESLLETVLLRNDHTCQMLLLPSHSIGDEEKQAESERLRAAEASWTPAQRAALAAQQANIDAWQASKDKPEDVAKLPRLELADISELPENIPTQVDAVHGVTVLRHDIPAGGIGYWNLYFDIRDLPEAALSQASLLCEVLGKLPTKHHSQQELNKKIRFTMGNLQFSVQSYSRDNAPEDCGVYLCAGFSALESKLQDAAALLVEILTETDFSQTGPIQELVQQTKMQMEQSVVDAGNRIGMYRVLAGISAEGVASECTSGFTYLQAVREMAAHPEGLGQTLQALAQRLLCTGRLTLSVTGGQKDAPAHILTDGLPAGEKAPQNCVLKPWGIKREGIVIPADISFAEQGGHIPYAGKSMVAGHVASLAYLWNAVRVQGGAYGVGMRPASSGVGVFYSYRDPNALRSLGCYRQTPDFMHSFVEAAPDITGFIIGTISATEPLLLPGGQGKAADGWYFRGTTYADRCTLRKEILSTTLADLAGLEADLRKFCDEGAICVVGARAQVEACDLDTVYVL